MMKKASALALLLLTAVGCDEKLSDLTGPTPNLQPTFSSIQQEIFNTTDASGRVACTTCHNTARAAFNGSLDLSTGNAYRNLVGVATSTRNPGNVRVIPGDPENSYLTRKLQGGPNIFGDRMPRTGGPYLTPGQIQVIKRWIQVGAPNN